MILFKFFSETREVLCHAFKGTCQITQLIIYISKNCLEPYMVNKYQSLSILTSLSQNLWKIAVLQWLISGVVMLS